MSARGVRPGLLHHKDDNPADAQPGKRQRVGTGSAPLAAAAPPPPEKPMVFAGREDVEAFLNEKMKGKNKMDYKGKSEQTMEYIACIRCLLEREDTYLAEIKRINGQLEATHKQHSEIVHDLEKTIEEKNSICGDLQKQCASLQETLKIVESEKMDAQRSLRDERETRMGVESLRNGLLEGLNGAKLQEKRLNVQRSDMTASETMAEYENMKKMLESYQSRLEEAEQTILHGEKLRKKLHNTILELKGNIRVFCRVSVMTGVKYSRRKPISG